MGEKRHIFFIEESQILYMYICRCVFALICIYFPLQEIQHHLFIPLCLDLLTYFQREECGKGKKYLYSEEM